MAYRWTKKSLENQTIIDAMENDVAINDYIDNINNNIDRENIPENQISEPMINTASLIRVFTKNNLGVNEGFCGSDTIFNAAAVNHPRGNEIFGLRYQSSSNLRSGGDWIIASNASFSNLEVEEGMMTVEWSCKYYIPKYRVFYKKAGAAPEVVAPKYVQWQIRYNGCIMYESGPQFTSWGNTNCSASFPVPQGNGEITIHYRLSGLIEDNAGQVVLTFFGGQITAINRRR